MNAWVVTNIMWDTDGVKQHFYSLPQEYLIPQGEQVDEDGISDWLSDKYGWCVEEFDHRLVNIAELEEENKKLKNDLRLCADGLIPHGMVGGIVETEREKRKKAEEESKKLRDALLDQLVSREDTIATLKTMPAEDIFELMEMDSNRFKKLEEENNQLKKKFEVLNSVQEAFRKQLRKEMDLLLNEESTQK